MKSIKNILVVGATGGSGRSTVDALMDHGYQVTALSRNASAHFNPPVRTIDGSALDTEVLTKAIRNQDAVIITLGISENPFRVRLLGSKNTPIDIRSRGTQKVIEVMKQLDVNRLIVQTTYGSGPSKHMLRTSDKLFFDWILKPQIDDTERQDKVVRESILDWTIVQPVHLSDEKEYPEHYFASTNFEVLNWSIPRSKVGEFNAMVLEKCSTIGQTITLSSTEQPTFFNG